jgi:UDP-N-acetylglucosamine--N-acetylmuramyl-(pentapeptide) pyrophosphoryl-undecaprenol N-acetylglucosamine transferase
MLPVGSRRKKHGPRSSVAKIYISASSEGYGHSTRALALAQNYGIKDVLVGTYDYALDRLQREGLMTVCVSQEYKLIGSEGSFDVGKTIIQNPNALLDLNKMVAEESEIIEQHGITLVIADGRIAPVIAASQLGIPCLVLTNQSNFYPFFQSDSALIKLFGKSFEWWMRSWLSSADEIWIPDFAPPDTVCLYNLSSVPHVKKRTRFVGPLLTFNPDTLQAMPRPQLSNNKQVEYYVVVSLGGHTYRQPLLDAVLAMAPHCPHIAFDLLTTLPIESLPDNCRQLNHVALPPAYFKAADCVITQAGHSTAMEILALGIPAVVVPDLNQWEQENNALKLEELGVAERVTYDELYPHPLALKEALLEVLGEPHYKQAAHLLKAKAEQYSKQNEVKALLQGYANRLVVY